MKVDRVYEGTNFITGLRAIAVFLVFLIHARGGGLVELGGAFSNLVMIGKYGVEVFFVISGFTVFYQLFEGEYTLKRFLLIRVSRLSIPYFPILIVIYAYLEFGGARFNFWDLKFNLEENYLVNLLYHISYLGMFDLKYANTMIGVEWTLYIEVFFYCVLGYLITRGVIKLKTQHLLIALFISVFIAASFLMLSYFKVLDRLLVHWMPFKYGWMFLLGGLGYYLRKMFKSFTSNSVSCLVSNITFVLSLVVFIVYLNLDFLNRIGHVNEVFFSFFTFILLILINDKAFFTRLLTNRLVMFLGTISFSFYLIHLLVITLNVAKLCFGVTDITVAFFVHFFVTVCAAFIWYKITEQFIYSKVKVYINSKYKDVSHTLGGSDVVKN